MKQSLNILGLLPAIFVLGTGCLPQVEPHLPVLLRLAGSTAMMPLLHELAEAYKMQREYVSFEILVSGSDAGLEALAEGQTDIAMVSRELTPEEKEKWQTTLLAWDALAIVVHAHNPITSLSLDEIRRIFAGEILSWGDVGGEGADIQVVTREEGSGSRASFQALVLTGGEYISSLALVLPTDQAVGEYIVQNPMAIGYASLATLPPGAQPLSVEGQAVSSAEYPLLRPFYLVIVPNAGEEVQDFVNFCLGPPGQAIVGNHYLRAR